MSITSDRTENPADILLWPDGFWCLREEFNQNFLRDHNYRVIVHGCDEWLKLYERHLAN